MAPAPKSLRKKSVLPAQNWIARVNHGLAMRKEGEKIIAQALRERLNKVGEQEWLRECEAEWGWSRSTAYRHLNPAQMEKHRVEAAAARPHNGDIPLRKDGKPDQRFVTPPEVVEVPPRPKPSDGLRDRDLAHKNLDFTLAQIESAVSRIENEVHYLTPKRIKILSEYWDRIGAVIERWGHDGDDQIRDDRVEVAEVEVPAGPRARRKIRKVLRSHISGDTASEDDEPEKPRVPWAPAEGLVDIPDEGPPYRPDMTRIREITTFCTLGHECVLKCGGIVGDIAIFGDGVQICNHPSEKWIKAYAKKVPEIRQADLTRFAVDSPEFGYEWCAEPIVKRKLRGLPVGTVEAEAVRIVNLGYEAAKRRMATAHISAWCGS